jgi:4-amino-4-deoxy-L-arabinose transferase-like glycosyltransferase
MAGRIMDGTVRFHRVYWLLLALFAAASAWATGFEFKDGDSRLYARMAAELSQLPLSRWLSPQWPAHYYKEGLFEEHMAFFFWPMAALGALGIPEVPAAVSINALYWLAILGCVTSLARLLFDAASAQLAAWSWLLSVGGVVYLVRANHETAVALGMLVACLAVLKLRDSLLWIPVLALAACWSVAMKGIVGLVLFPSLVVVAWFCARNVRSLVALGVAAVAVLAFLWIHDVAFESANGHSFIRAYLDIHLGYAEQKEHVSRLHKLGNLGYYLGVSFYWFAPWSLLFAWGSVQGARRRISDGVRPWMWASLGVVLVHIAFFSVFDRRASRYIYSVFPLMAVTCGALLPLLPQRAQKPVNALLARGPWPLAAAMVLVLAARLYFHLFHHVFFSWNLANPE